MWMHDVPWSPDAFEVLMQTCCFFCRRTFNLDVWLFPHVICISKWVFHDCISYLLTHRPPATAAWLWFDPFAHWNIKYKKKGTKKIVLLQLQWMAQWAANHWSMHWLNYKTLCSKHTKHTCRKTYLLNNQYHIWLKTILCISTATQQNRIPQYYVYVHKSANWLIPIPYMA